MDNETLFYVCGVVLAVSALVVSFVGLKTKDFPGRALPVVVLWFAVFVAGAATFAVRYSGEEQEARAAELEQAGEEIEKAETSGPYENEGGALGGETEELEEQAEKEAEGSAGEEPVGPTEGSQAGKGGQAPEPGSSQGKQGAGEKGGAAASTTLQLAADPAALAFDKQELTAKAGEVTIDFDNPSAIPHNVVIEADGKELAGFEPITEGAQSVSAELKPGAYTFYCSVPGHREAGMEGTLSVE